MRLFWCCTKCKALAWFPPSEALPIHWTLTCLPESFSLKPAIQSTTKCLGWTLLCHDFHQTRSIDSFWNDLAIERGWRSLNFTFIWRRMNSTTTNTCFALKCARSLYSFELILHWRLAAGFEKICVVACAECMQSLMRQIKSCATDVAQIFDQNVG